MARRNREVRYEIRNSRSKKQGFYFRIVTNGNNKILAHSETYVGYRDVVRAVQLIDPKAEIEDRTEITR